MRLATWNLDRCRPGSSERAVTLAAMMAEINADVWVLTETHRAFSPGSNYRLVSHSADAPDRDAGCGECWVAIWSKDPAEPITMTADLERVAAIRTGTTVVVGTVLPWLNDPRDSRLRGEAAFRARLDEQAADWRRLRASSKSLCIAGDFNQDLLASGHYYGSAGGREALRAALQGACLECLTGGADDPVAVSPPLGCIDHICVGGLRACGSPRSSAWPAPGTLDRCLADHYGTWADLESDEPS